MRTGGQINFLLNNFITGDQVLFCFIKYFDFQAVDRAERAEEGVPVRRGHRHLRRRITGKPSYNFVAGSAKKLTDC